ncbi:dihydrofolate reductase family protein [Actinoplanes sp. NPDC024001]|uniref:dihydrofolate reductase family protein n=1 Tax=Actinoplanes sp. NPDC024001 TaxID=3154598 RepID=UPI0033C06295
MRKIVLYSLLSLDGVAEHPDRYVFEFDEVMDANLARVISSQDAVVLGRRTYDDWAPYWPTGEHQPFADFINAVPKHVVTSTEPTVPWANTEVVPGDVTKHLRQLREQPGGDIGVHGSIVLARSLLAADLIDELRLVITPVQAGEGRRLFADGDVPRRFTLTMAEASPSGALLADYTVRRD